jgi:hypothetical protein
MPLVENEHRPAHGEVSDSGEVERAVHGINMRDDGNVVMCTKSQRANDVGKTAYGGTT